MQRDNYIPHMTPEQILHTFARQYAIQRFDHWSSEYSKIYNPNRMGDYSNAEYATFPKYNVASDIRRSIENYDYENLPGYESLLAALLDAGDVIGPATTENNSSSREELAEQEERENWKATIAHVANDRPDYVEPLLYRKTLDGVETKTIQKLLKEKWGILEQEYFYPVGQRTHASLIAINGSDDPNYTEIRKRIDRFFNDQRIERAFAYFEFGQPYHHYADVELLDIWYGDGGEGYWFDLNMDWIIHCSHEYTMTLGGSIAAIISSSDPRIIID